MCHAKTNGPCGTVHVAQSYLVASCMRNDCPASLLQLFAVLGAIGMFGNQVCCMTCT